SALARAAGALVPMVRCSSADVQRRRTIYPKRALKTAVLVARDRLINEPAAAQGPQANQVLVISPTTKSHSGDGFRRPIDTCKFALERAALRSVAIAKKQPDLCKPLRLAIEQHRHREV